jgi:flagellar biosynthetic protein FliQ
MNQDLIIDLTQEAVMTVITVSGPLLLLALVVGLIISIFQTITSIQEQTLAFVPKILAVFLGVYFFGPWMMDKMVELFIRVANNFGQFIIR